MLTKWSVTNFKCFEMPTEIELKPLTIFAGINSGGKSTLFQSILLISQTFLNRDTSRTLALNGTFVRLGDLNDIRTFGSSEPSITIGWEAETAVEGFYSTIGSQYTHAHYLGSRYKKISGEIKFDNDSTKEGGGKLKPNLTSLVLRCAATENGKESWITLEKNRTDFAIPSEYADNAYESGLSENLKFLVQMDDFSTLESTVDFESITPIGASLIHFLPEYLLVKYKVRSALLSGLKDALSGPVRSALTAHLIVPPAVASCLQSFGISVKTPSTVRDLSRLVNTDARNISVLEDVAETLFTRITEIVNEGSDEYSSTYIPLPPALRDCRELTENLFATDVKYLGPLRDQPKAIYPLTGTLDSTDVGLKGENAAAVYYQHQQDIVQAILPSAFNLSGEFSGLIELCPLGKAIKEWMNYLGLTNEIIINDKGKHGHELKVRTPGTKKPHDLTHAGVGVSQVFPILVMCLTANKGSILLIEQPELHLHPKVQALLGDFFLAISLLGKQCLIETHSEYLIDKLRWRTAAATEMSVNNLFDVYFVTKDRNSTFEKLEISSYGAIVNWPDGFFDQSHQLSEQILLAATRKMESEEQNFSE